MGPFPYVGSRKSQDRGLGVARLRPRGARAITWRGRINLPPRGRPGFSRSGLRGAARARLDADAKIRGSASTRRKGSRGIMCVKRLRRRCGQVRVGADPSPHLSLGGNDERKRRRHAGGPKRPGRRICPAHRRGVALAGGEPADARPCRPLRRAGSRSVARPGGSGG